MGGAKNSERISTLKAIKRFITRLLMGLSLGVMASPAMALDEVLEVEIHNATSAAIAPGRIFSWLESPANAGHDFVIEPGGSRELTYYLPQSRGNESFGLSPRVSACVCSVLAISPRTIREAIVRSMPVRRGRY